MGILVLKRALEIAKEKALDLVEIAPTAKPPVCRIMDFSKYKYDQEKKERKIKKKQRRQTAALCDRDFIRLWTHPPYWKVKMAC